MSGCRPLAMPEVGGRMPRAPKRRALRGCLSVELTDDQRARLDAVSALPPLNAYFIFNLPREMLYGGMQVG